MLASGSLSAHAATKKPAPAAAKKAAAPSTALHKVEVLRWSFDKWIPGMFCTKVDEPIDPHGWDDNFLCSTRDLGLRWSSLGPVSGMVCTQFEETSDPDGWGDNYLCAPQDYGFKWSMKGTIKGMQCLQITEPYDPHTWKDNFLCWPAAGASPLNAVVSPPQDPTDVINLIRARHDYQSYLELGQGAKEDNFDAIGGKIRIGVDPDRKSNANFQMPYDDFFAQNQHTFDLIFINGLHEANQVEKALANSLKILNQGGTIVMHNLNPISPAQQTVPRPAGQDDWKGDVWKAWVKLKAAHDDLRMHVINFDTGFGIITRGKQTKLKLPAELTYQALDANRKEWLNLIDVKTFLKDNDVQ
jgi:SAM-dependent methyltransferase